MSRFHSYINTSAKLITLYKGGQPFAVFIKGFFAKEKKYGSKDRKQISSLCYNYFRLGFALNDCPIEQKIIVATFLCEQTESEFLEKINPGWNQKIKWPLNKKMLLVTEQFLISDIFPFKNLLSNNLEIERYCLSLLAQPSLFLRIRPQCRITTLKKLKKSKLDYKLLGEDCIELPTATNADDFFIIDKEVVVQDYNSQQVLNYLAVNETGLFDAATAAARLATWDCCAASGGKSILLVDILKQKIDLTVSDIRISIVLNLHQRFKKANIKQYKYFIADIGDTQFTPPVANYQLIICDAPCTGSGTWGRTPDQLCFFKESSVKEFSKKQKRIVGNVVPHLMDGGIFIYITCSVFKEENEAVANFASGELKLKMLHSELLIGADKKADTMFVAIFRK
jgi:16S rRNA (cytosine967-C5)-methyltransferase